MSGADRVKVWLLLAALAAATLYLFWYACRAWRENRVVGDTPASRVRSAAQGYVELIGHGLMPADVTNDAPLTHKPCVWWRYKIEQRKGGRSNDWNTIDEGISEAPFILDDGTGQCLVDPRGAQVFPSSTSVWYGDSEWPGVRLPDGVGILGKLTDTLFSGGRYRYTEERLQARETVCALGAFRSLGGVNAENPERAVAELLREWKQDQKALLERFDRNHDGELDAGEWELARAAAHNQVVNTMLVKPAAPGMSIVSQPADGRAFLLAGTDSQALARRLRRNALSASAGCILAGAALGFVWSVSSLW
jgi:hypothetical protein